MVEGLWLVAGLLCIAGGFNYLDRPTINTMRIKRAKGIDLLGAGQPIVLCAIDWVCISNEGYDAFHQAHANVAGTIPERIAVHTLHQPDTPWWDFTEEQILNKAGLNPLHSFRL